MFQRTKQGTVEVVSVNVALTSDYADHLSEALEQCLADGQPRAVLDLQRVSLMDGVGLERLLDAQEKFEQRGGSLRLAAPTPLCNDVLAATGVAGRFEIFGSVNAAVGSFVR
jgi:anti-anti-sigma factor